MSKTIQIGEVFGDTQEVIVDDSATVRQALQIAGVRIAPSQQLTSYSDAARIEMDEVARDGETYLLTSSHVSGR